MNIEFTAFWLFFKPVFTYIFLSKIFLAQEYRFY